MIIDGKNLCGFCGIEYHLMNGYQCSSEQGHVFDEPKPKKVCEHCGNAEHVFNNIHAKCPYGPKNKHEYVTMTRLKKAEMDLKSLIIEVEAHFEQMEPNREYWTDGRTPSGHCVGFTPMDHPGGQKWCLVVKQQGGKLDIVKNMIPEQQTEILRPEFGVLGQLEAMIEKTTNGRAVEIEAVNVYIENFLKKDRSGE